MAGIQPLRKPLGVIPYSLTELEPQEAFSSRVLLFVCGCDAAIHGRAVCCLDGGGPSFLGKGSTTHQVSLPTAKAPVEEKNREAWNLRTSSHIFNFFVIAW